MSAATQTPQALLVVLSAPSGAGKTTLGQNLLNKVGSLRRAVTCTTRMPRPGENDGVDYHFLSKEAFARHQQLGHFLEHATVYGNHYGTLSSEVWKHLDAGMDVLLTIDVQGADTVRQAAAKDGALKARLVTVLLTTPTWAELEQRLRGRGTEAQDALQRRLDTAAAELSHAPRFDYILVSGTPDEDCARMSAILTAEKMRSHRAATFQP